MLSPRIHGLEHFRSLNRFTARHDWRPVESGMIFRVTNATYQTLAILPRDERHGRYQARVVIQQLGTGRTFTEPLAGFWSGLDRGVFGSPRYSNLFVHWEPQWVKKSIERHARKLARERARVRRFLVVSGLVVEGGAA